MEIRLLGPTEVVIDGVMIKLTAAKPRWLLAFLALDPGRSRSTASICDALWGADQPQTSVNLVQGYVRDLRRQLGRDRVETTPTGYSLAISAEDVDASVFDDLVEKGKRAFPHDLAACGHFLDRAVGLWKGQALEDGPDHGPLGSAAVRLHEQLLDARELKTEADLALGRHASLVPVLEELTRLHPYRERFWVQLATALYRSDRQAEALLRCNDARAVLLEDLGLSPGPELRRVEQRILDQDATLLADRRAPDHSPVRTSPGFVGRGPNLARLAGLLDEAKHGSQRLLFIGGEPGIGKTSIVNEFAAHVGEDAIVLIGRSDEHVAAPYLAFAQAISDHLGSLDPSTRADMIAPRQQKLVALIPSLADGSSDSGSVELSLMERFELFRWLLERLRADGPLVLILEDVHWADSTTLGLLRYLTDGERLPGTVVVATYRTSHPSPILDDLLADLRSNNSGQRMILGGLRREALRELIGAVDSAMDEIDWIENETDGNPFFVRELVRHAVDTGSFDGVPDGITEVVRRRVRRLSRPAQELLVRAAVLGDDAPVGLLRLLSGDLENLGEMIDEAVQAGILVEVDTTEPRYRFSHSIIRKAAAASLTVVRRQDLHLAAAKAWEQFRNGRLDSPTTAAHYLGAGSAAPSEDALGAFVTAADYLDKAGAKVESVMWYDHALDLLDEDDPRVRSIRLTRFVVAQAAWHWHYDRKSIVRTNARR